MKRRDTYTEIRYLTTTEVWALVDHAQPGPYERLRAALKAAALDETYGCHSLRHSYGTALAAQGVPMRMLQEWMGHRDIQTTQRYADCCPNPGGALRRRSPFARGSNPGNNLRAPVRNGEQLNAPDSAD